MTELPQAHSPLGGSGASRWLLCPGSVSLSQGHDDPESDYAIEGSAAHALAEQCLLGWRTGQVDGDTIEETTGTGEHTIIPAWEFIGWYYDGKELRPAEDMEPAELAFSPVKVEAEMATAVQEYLDAVERIHPKRILGEDFFVEHKFHVPSIHPSLYSTSDLVKVYWGRRELHIWDYKHGAGIVVEVEDNAQLKYYAVGVLASMDLWDKVDRIVTRVAQPRGFHFDGAIREHTYAVHELAEWLVLELQPGMERAMVSRDTVSGDHCRFCPARYAYCPALAKDMKELEAMTDEVEKKGGARHLNADELARYLSLFARAKIVNKAAEETAFARMEHGIEIPGFKIVNKKAFRAYKEGAEAAAKKKFGAKAYETKLRSPAQLEKIVGGDKFCAEWAYKPDTGRTVAPRTDPRSEVSRNTKALFTPQGKKAKASFSA